METKLILCLYSTVGGKTMINRLSGNKVVGVKQTVKAIRNGKAKTVYIAGDAEGKLVQPIIQLAQENSIELVTINTMKELGKLCGIDVGAATCAVLKE